MIIICEHCRKKILVSKVVPDSEMRCPHCNGVFKVKVPKESGYQNNNSICELKYEVSEPIGGRTIDRVTVIKLRGDIDTPSVPVLKKILDEQLEKKNTDIILDMSGVRYINSVGMGLLTRMKNEFKNKFGDIKLCGLRDNVKRLMKVIGLLKIFEVYSDVETTKKAFAGLFDGVTQQQSEVTDEPKRDRDALIKCLICGKVSEMYKHDNCKKYLQLTRNYVWEHKNASIEEVSRATGVPEQYIRVFISNNWFVTTGGYYTEAGK